MSLEELIIAHTAALTANTEAVSQLSAALVNKTPYVESAKAKAAEAKAAEAKAAEAKPEAEPEVTSLEDDVKTAEAGAVTIPFGTVRELVIKLSSVHREAIKAINAKHGIARLSSLLSDENNFATVTDQPKLEAIYSDLQDLEVM